MKLRALQSEQDARRVAELLAKVWPGEDHWQTYRFYSNRLTRCPYYKLDHSRIIEVDNEIVSHVGIRDMTMRVGSTSVKVGGIGDVVTDSIYRRRGYATQLVDNAIHYIQDHAYDISLLGGPSAFYGRFGYAVVMLNYKSVITTCCTLEAPAALKVRFCQEPDLSSIQDLYTKNNERKTGSIVRTDVEWEKPWAGDWAHWEQGLNWATWQIGIPLGRSLTIGDCIVATDETNEVRGYACWSPWGKSLLIAEVGVADREAAETLLNALGQIAKGSAISDIEVLVPPDQLFAECCFAYGAERISRVPQDSLSGIGRWMGRITNLTSLFEKIAAELSARVSRSRFYDWCGSLSVETDIGSVVIGICEGKVRLREHSEDNNYVLTIPQSKLAQLVFGYRSPCVLLAELRAGMDDEAWQLINVLFQEQCPFIWSRDRF